MFEKAQDYEYIVQGHADVWAVEMGSEKEHGNFEAFVQSFKPDALQGDTHDFTYQSPTLGQMRCGWGKPLTVNGEQITIHGYQRYDHPYCQMLFDAKEMAVTCGGAALKLDFDANTRRES